MLSLKHLVKVLAPNIATPLLPLRLRPWESLRTRDETSAGIDDLPLNSLGDPLASLNESWSAGGLGGPTAAAAAAAGKERELPTFIPPPLQ